MDPLVTAVPGSRRPISIPSNASSSPSLSSNSALSDVSSSSRGRTISSIRRKPSVTYRSPSTSNPVGLRIEGSAAAILKLTSATHAATHVRSNQRTVGRSPMGFALKGTSKKKASSGMGPPLPLYHPLGALARSLPDLEPEKCGLPNIVTVDDTSRRASSRTRRPVAKLRDNGIEDERPAEAILGYADVQETGNTRGSPRKRRGGGAGGGKRKRKDADEQDATYPAVKRPTRGHRSTRANAFTETTTGDGDDAVGVEGAEGTPETEQEKLPERRSRRTRATAARRNSDASESTTAGVDPNSHINGRRSDDGTVDAEMDVPVVDEPAVILEAERTPSVHVPSSPEELELQESSKQEEEELSTVQTAPEKQEKEEGEVSSDGASPKDSQIA